MKTIALSCCCAAACLLLAAVISLAPDAEAQDFDRARRLFLEKADCAYCHGWAGDGSGQGQSPGGAANLRRSQLQRDQLITVPTTDLLPWP